MAGNYPDVPGPRMAYDRDGSVGFRHKYEEGVITTLSGAQLEALNDESDSSYYDPGTGADNILTGIIFPELRDLVGYFIRVTSGFSTALHMFTSVDTTNGFDGTWVDQGVYTNSPGFTNPNYRSNIIELGSPITGIKAVKFGAGFSANAAIYASLHLFGNIATGETPDRLRLWHPTLDQELDGAYFDFGNVAQGTSLDRDFRVKNNSATLTANNISVSIDSLTDAAIQDAFTLSDDGSTFGPTIEFTSLAPGVISGVCTLRRTTPVNASLGLWAKRVVAQAASWS